jgi:hypothetical protein
VTAIVLTAVVVVVTAACQWASMGTVLRAEEQQTLSTGQELGHMTRFGDMAVMVEEVLMTIVIVVVVASQVSAGQLRG